MTRRASSLGRAVVVALGVALAVEQARRGLRRPCAAAPAVLARPDPASGHDVDGRVALARGVLDEGLVIEGQVYDSDPTSTDEPMPTEPEQPVTVQRGTS